MSGKTFLKFFWKIFFDLNKGPNNKKSYSENFDEILIPKILKILNKDKIKKN